MSVSFIGLQSPWKQIDEHVYTGLMDTEKTHPECGWHYGMAQGSGLNGKEKVRRAAASVCLSRLDVTWPSYLSLLLSNPGHHQPYFQTVSPSFSSRHVFIRPRRKACEKTKDTTIRTKLQPTDWKIIFPSPVSDRANSQNTEWTEEVRLQQTKQPNLKMGYRARENYPQRNCEWL